jgi:hypothetical protein
MEFVTIPKSEFELLTKAKKSWLTQEEWLIIMEHEEIFKKFLGKIWFSYQISLAEWKAKWQEEKTYSKIEAIWEIIKALWDYEDSMEKYKIKKEEEELKKKEKKKDL